MTEPCIIVIDNGSAITKAGFTVDKAPRVVFPTVTAREMEHSMTMHERDRKDTYIGHEAESMKHFVTMKYPIHRGIVTDWSDMEKIWAYIFSNELKIESERYPVLLTETALNPKINREKITEIMFETFSVPALYVAAQAVLSMYASDRITGLAVDIGDGVSQIVPVYEGHAMAHATLRIDLGGHDLTDYMAQMLLERGYAFHTFAEKEIVRDIKEKLCYVALDFENETQKISDPVNIEKLYELSDGTIITFVEERFKCPEVLFQPSLIDYEHAGIHEYILNSISKTDIDIRKEMYNNICLSGGSTMFDALPERLSKELKNLVPSETNINVVARSDRKNLAWLGGSLFAKLPTFTQECISNDEYEDSGDSIVHRKCF